MGAFCDRMDEELAIRGYSPKTCTSYLGAMRSFVKFARQSPDKLGAEDVRRYQVHLVKQRKSSPSTVNVHVSAIRFFYEYVLKRAEVVREMPRTKPGHSLPVILSVLEVAALFLAVSNLKHKAILVLLYATGLRLSEAQHLRIEDLDSDRMRIRVRAGKGRKDRDVMLSPKLLVLLREYWRQFRPALWLFPGENPEEPMHESSIQRIVAQAASRAGLRKHVSPHSLRHAFATHLLESGVSILVVQKLLGHTSLQTTAIYLHVAKNYLQATPSPLDSLPWPASDAVAAPVTVPQHEPVR